jgi:hypothetical protein
MNNEVTDLLSALHDGTMSIDDVARRFRARSWPRRNRPDPATYLELATQAQEDPENDLADSFDQVAADFHRGNLSSEHYGILAEAMAESMRAEDRRNAESADSG